MTTMYMILLLIFVVCMGLVCMLVKINSKLQTRMQIRQRILQECDELSDWQDAYEICFDYMINTLKGDSNGIGGLTKTEIVEHLWGDIIPRYRELRMYAEGYSQINDTRHRLITILEDLT